MADGYIRQAASEIAPNLPILSSSFNKEFNQLLAAFSELTGHRHDGSVGGGAQLTPASFTGLSGSGILASTGSAFVSRTITGTANQITATNGSGVSGNPTLSLPSTLIAPGTLNTVGDFSVATNKFTVAAATGNTAVAGTLGVTGNTTVGGTLGVTGNTTITGTLGVTGAITGFLSGNASTATALATPRNFSIAGSTGLTASGVSFNGTSDVALSLTGTLSPANGGTGVNNGSNTLTLAGNVTFAGAFTQTFTATANSSVTLPTSGTLATLAGVETLTNKTITSPAISGGTINNTGIGGTTPAAGAFTSLAATNASFANVVTVNGTTTNGQSVNYLDTTVNNVRWQLANTGTSVVFNLNAFTSAGAFIDSPLSIANASGGTVTIGGVSTRPAIFTGTLNVASTAASTTSSTGALTVNGGLGVAGAGNFGGNITQGTGTAGSILRINGNSGVANQGAALYFQAAGSTRSGIGNEAGLISGGTDTDGLLITANGFGIRANVKFASGTYSGTTFTENFSILTTGALATNGTIRSANTGGIGYAAGAGGSVTQLTSKSTAVTLNAASGAITMNAASLAANTTVQFTFNNTSIAATDVVILNQNFAASSGYNIWVYEVGAGYVNIAVRNVTAGALADAVKINFAVIKAVTS
jgi:trimeric autotransporter adhesin